MGHGCLSLLSVVCCQVEVSSTGRSLFQRSPTECDGEACKMRRPWPTRGCCAMERKNPQETLNFRAAGQSTWMRNKYNIEPTQWNPGSSILSDCPGEQNKCFAYLLYWKITHYRRFYEVKEDAANSCIPLCPLKMNPCGEDNRQCVT
jgi:hypothetical protein